MRAAEADVVERETGDADQEDHRKLRPQPDIKQDRHEVTAAFRPGDQERKRAKKSDLGQRHEFERSERSRGEG